MGRKMAEPVSCPVCGTHVGLIGPLETLAYRLEERAEWAQEAGDEEVASAIRDVIVDLELIMGGEAG